MGYTTEFRGYLQPDKPFTKEQTDYINTFANTRRMIRNPDLIKTEYPGWKDLCLNGELGPEGQYFIGGAGDFGQDYDKSVIDGNTPPKGQPGLWCQWIINEDGDIEWNGGEKFYNYIDWIEYLIKHFFNPWGILLNGSIKWSGEDFEDLGVIKVVNNEVTVKEVSFD